MLGLHHAAGEPRVLADRAASVGARYLLAYRATLQAQALLLVARKLQASLIVQGEIGDGGLTAHSADDDNLTLLLAPSR